MEFELPNDGWMKLVPLGEFIYRNDTDNLIQVVDKESLEAIKNNFKGELFIDKDHLSLNNEASTEAMGWVMGDESIEVRDDGLWAKPRWTTEGYMAVSGGSYRYISPVFNGDNAVRLNVDKSSGLTRYRMTELLEAGLTNRPNMTFAPLSNKKNFSSVGTEEKQTDPEGVATKKERKTMKLVNRALDLSPDASEDAAVSEIVELQEKVETTENKLNEKDSQIAELKKQISELEAQLKELEETVEQHEDEVIEAQLDTAELENKDERAAYKALILANKEQGTAALNALVGARKELAKAKGSPLTNRDTAKTPEGRKEFSVNSAKAAFRAQIEGGN